MTGKHRTKKWYLASFFLPEDSRWWVAFSAAEEGHGATWSCDLVTWPNDHLRRHCSAEDQSATMTKQLKSFLYATVLGTHSTFIHKQEGLKWWDQCFGGKVHKEKRWASGEEPEAEGALPAKGSKKVSYYAARAAQGGKLKNLEALYD